MTKVLETLVSFRSIQLGGRLKLHDRIVGSYANLQVCMYAGGAFGRVLGKFRTVLRFGDANVENREARKYS